MLQNTANRIPMPSEAELAALPPMAQGILGYFSNKLEPQEYKNLSRLFVDGVNGNLKTNGTPLKYRNPELRQLATQWAQIGEYNPDKIPISTYEKMRLDPVIALGTALIELPIISQNFRIECIDERISSVVDALMRPIYRSTVKSMLRAVQFGFAVGEKLYEKIRLKVVKENERGGKSVVYDQYTISIKKIKFVHPKSIRIERAKDTEQIKNVLQTDDYAAPGDDSKPKVPIQKCVWFANDAEYGNFFGNSRYKNSYQAWYFGALILQFALRYLERRGAPAAKGRAPLGTTTTSDGTKVNNIDMMLEVANALISNSAVAIPSQYDKNGNLLWDVGLVEDENQRGDLFLDMLKYVNQLKLRGLFIPDKTGVVEGSSTNATSEQETDIHLLSEEALIQCIEDCLNEQVIDELVRFNFPPTKQVPCYIKIERLNYGKRTLLRDVLARMLMLYAGSMRDGNWPNWLPSVKEISHFLEIPGNDVNKLFLPMGTSSDKDNGNSSNAKDDAQSDATDTQTKKQTRKNKRIEPLDKQQKVQQRNKDASPRKERTRRDRRARER